MSPCFQRYRQSRWRRRWKLQLNPLEEALGVVRRYKLVTRWDVWMRTQKNKGRTSMRSMGFILGCQCVIVFGQQCRIFIGDIQTGILDHCLDQYIFCTVLHAVAVSSMLLPPLGLCTSSSKVTWSWHHCRGIFEASWEQICSDQLQYGDLVYHNNALWSTKVYNKVNQLLRHGVTESIMRRKIEQNVYWRIITGTSVKRGLRAIRYTRYNT